MKKFAVVVNMKGVIGCRDAQLVLAKTEDEAKEKAVSLLRSIYGDVFSTYNVESCKLL